MIPVPVRVYHVAHPAGRDRAQRHDDLRLRDRYPGIDHQQAIRAGQDADVAPGSLQHAHVAAQGVHRDGVGRGGGVDV